MPFSPEIGAGSPVLEALVRGPAAALSAVLLIVGDRAQRSGFGAATATAVADAWSVADRTPVLVDLAFDEPALHTHLGVANDEGVADAFAFGTSLRMLWREIEGRRFSFLSAGYATDSSEVLASGDWRRIIAQESSTGHTLLLYVPANAPGLETLAGKVGAVIVIAEENDLPAAAEVLPRPYAIVAVLTPNPVKADTQDQSIIDASSNIGLQDARDAVEPTDIEPSPAELASDEPAASEDTKSARRAPPLILDDDSEADRAESGASSLGRKADASEDAAAPARDMGSLSDRGTGNEEYEKIRVPREGAGREELIADLRARQRAALMAPPADAEPVGGWASPHTSSETPAQASTMSRAESPTIDGVNRRGEPVEHTRVAREMTPTGSLPGEPPRLEPGGSPRGRRKETSWLWPVLLLGFAVVAAGVAWNVFGRKPAPAPAAPVNTAIPRVDSLAMVALPYVVAIEAYTEMKTAEDRLRELSDGERWTHFFVAPLVRGEVNYYHVFAGPLRDSVQAAAALDTLLAHKVKTGAIPGDVRQVPLSFMVDRFQSQSDALKRVDELNKTGIPTFIVPGAVNGVTQWRVYAGAYAGPAEADVMRALLKGAGVKDSLVTRTGRSNQ